MKSLIVALSAALILALSVRADVIVTTDGARLVGKIAGISEGTISLATHYAGTLAVKQSEVVSIETDKPVSVRLAGGVQMQGTVVPAPAPAAPGALRITGAVGTISTTMSAVAAVWPAGAVEPAVAALQHRWNYEISADLEGATGNTNSLNTGVSFAAESTTPVDTLKYYGSYDRAVAQGIQSADQFKAGIDYAYNLTPVSSWFLRDEGGFDRIMNERYYNVAAGGYGFDLVKTAKDVLTARAGLAYRYTDYLTSATPTVSSPAGDFELAHDFNDPVWGEVSNNIAAVPSFADFSDITVTQDSFYQVPLKNPRLKLRIGFSNNYNSEPGRGFKRLDTLYYTRLVFDWGATPPAVP
ncbi:MAG: DUF481 domain-containing protein [Opitutaceae bacterium]